MSVKLLLSDLNGIYLYFGLFHFSHLHSVLPANGAPVARQRTSRVKELYSEYVRERTLRNWKFWIVCIEHNNDKQ